MKTQQKSSGNKSLGLDPQWVKNSSGGAHKRQTEETRGDARRKLIGIEQPTKKIKARQGAPKQRKKNAGLRTETQRTLLQSKQSIH
jgi:hypothetical protein